MFLGSMIMGPLGGLVIKYIDRLLDQRIPAGFEMVINNFSLGIAGMLLCLLGFEVIGPAVLIANNFVKECIESLVHAGYLPLLSLINEPAKILFLNNAIDPGRLLSAGHAAGLGDRKIHLLHGCLKPQPRFRFTAGVCFLWERDGEEICTGAMIIHFLGGIHELYFPYVLMKPLTLIGMIAGE